MALMGSKDWVAEAPVSRMVSLVVTGGPVAPWIVCDVMFIRSKV